MLPLLLSFIRLPAVGTSLAYLTPLYGNQPNQKEKHMSMDLNTIKAANSVDARGCACPGPLLEAKKGIAKVKIGEVLEILSNDSGTRSDLPIWAAKVGHEYLGHLSHDGYDKLFILRKK